MKTNLFCLALIACCSLAAGQGPGQGPADPRGRATSGTGPRVNGGSGNSVNPNPNLNRGINRGINRGPATGAGISGRPAVSPPPSITQKPSISGRPLHKLPATTPPSVTPQVKRTVTRPLAKPATVQPARSGVSQPSDPPATLTNPAKPGLAGRRPSAVPGKIDKPNPGLAQPSDPPATLTNPAKPGLAGRRPSAVPGKIDKPNPGLAQPSDPHATLTNPAKPGLAGRRPSAVPGKIDKPNPGLAQPSDPPAALTKPSIGKRPGTALGKLTKPDPAGNQPEALPAFARRPGYEKVYRPGRPHRPFEQASSAEPLLRPATRPAQANHWGNRPGWGNRNQPWWNVSQPLHSNKSIFVSINTNFRNNWNWSYNQNHWGYRPWWNRPACYPWYGQRWSYRWNHRWYYHNACWFYPRPWPGYVIVVDDDDFALAVGWGILGWGLGNLIYETGYQTYYNPYHAQPVALVGGTAITYDEPLSTLAARTAPADESSAKSAEVASAEALEQSRAAFKRNDYLAALPLANKAVSLLPGDTVLHEYRALVLFALAKYSDAAAVLHSILASGPGWDWTTMMQLYDSQETYLGQLQKLEQYSAAKPDAADARFLLGYHYLVCGHLDRAATAFEAVTKLQPADAVAAQLLNLSRNSAKPGEENQPAAQPEATSPESSPPAPEPPPVDQLVGSWKSDKGKDGTVTLDLSKEGNFTWTFTKDSKSNKLEGDWSINDKGLLVLDAGNSQMVASITQPAPGQLRFVLAGGPEGDPGLLFENAR